MTTLHHISWLTLEQYHLAELPEEKQKAVSEHLAECDACRRCLDAIEAPRRLAPLPETGPHKSWFPSLDQIRWRQAALVAATLLISGIAAVYFSSRSPEPEVIPGGGITCKGGDDALTVVRERDGQITQNPGEFKDGDRFSLRLTVSDQDAPRWDTVVIQGETIYFPNPAPLALQAGNQISLPGAFVLTGDESVTICAMPVKDVSHRSSIEREGASALPAEARCREISPSEQ